MSSQIRVGIIGTGSIANAHLRAYQDWPEECRVVAVADIMPDRAEAMAQAAKAEAWYTSYQDLLARPDIDLVSICTPPFVHAEAAIAALKAGKHVLCEKPMGASLAECDQMIAAADESGKLLSVVFQNRFNHDLWRTKAVVDAGLLGRPLYGKCETLWYRGRNYYDIWWRGTWEMECGGATINHAVHYIDAFLWMLGDPVSVYADMDALAHDIEVEDLSIAIVRFANGALGQITSSVNCHQNYTAMEITGEDAAVAVPWKVTARTPDGVGFPVDNKALVDQIGAHASQVSLPRGGGHSAQAADLLHAIRTGGKPVVDGREGRRSIELITALYKSATTGQKVTLPLAKDDPFYTTEGLRQAVKRHPSSKLHAGRR